MKVFTDSAFTKACGDSVSYGFYTRVGGVSEGFYTSLNCAPGSNDDPAAITENRARVAAHVGQGGKTISSMWQCHSADCVYIDAPVGNDRPHADGLVTDQPDLPIGILTADCGPVLFIGAKQNGAPVIGASHAGWGGALKGILEDTIIKMQNAGATLDSIKACVGPCIAQSSYEVKEDFMRPFIIAHEDAEHFFKSAQKPGHLMFDMPGYIAMRLSLAGIKQISLMGIDTYKDEENCFSYRRATHRAEPDYGRQISAIVING